MAALAVIATLAACATTQMTAEWRDPAFAGGSLKGQRVLVACRTPDATLRRVCEDQWASQLSGQGAAPVASYTVPGFPLASGDSTDELRAAVRSSGVAAFVGMTLQAGDVTLVNPGPQIGVGIGGGSGGGYRGGGVSFGSFGISVPIGTATATQSLAASSSLVDAASGKVVWSGNASTPASGTAQAQVSALTQVTLEAMRRAGVL